MLIIFHYKSIYDFPHFADVWLCSNVQKPEQTFYSKSIPFPGLWPHVVDFLYIHTNSMGWGRCCSLSHHINRISTSSSYFSSKTSETRRNTKRPDCDIQISYMAATDLCKPLTNTTGSQVMVITEHQVRHPYLPP